MDPNVYKNSSVMAGVLLIVLGIVLLAVTQGAFELNWGRIWPIFPMLGGGFLLFMALGTQNPQQRAGMVLGGTVPLLLGVFFFGTTSGTVSWGLWPIYPLIVGVAFFAAYFASGREQPAYLAPGAITSVVGVVFLGVILSGEGYGVIGRLWPLFLIIAGVLLLVMPRFYRRET